MTAEAFSLFSLIVLTILVLIDMIKCTELRRCVICRILGD